jgi:organic radical activating enzyme
MKALFQQDNREIGSITFISSAVCNLNCSFCYLHKNKSYKKFNEINRKAW